MCESEHIELQRLSTRPVLDYSVISVNPDPPFQAYSLRTVEMLRLWKARKI